MKFTRFEKARIIGARALQLSMGAPSLIKGAEKISDPLLIAWEELKLEVIPITVRRHMPERKELGE